MTVHWGERMAPVAKGRQSSKSEASAAGRSANCKWLASLFCSGALMCIAGSLWLPRDPSSGVADVAVLGLEEAGEEGVCAEEALAGEADVVAVDGGEAFVDQGPVGDFEFPGDFGGELAAEVGGVDAAELELEDHFADEGLVVVDGEGAVDGE